MSSDYLQKLEEGAKRAINFLVEELATIHTGRASVNLVSDILVMAYGSKTPLKQIANITVTDPRSLAVQPWDKGNLIQIENAIRESNLGFSVVNTGDIIRVNIPQLTEERRNEYVKLAKAKAEEAKIMLRNVRHEIWEETKKAKVNSEISEDEMYFRENEINKLVESYNKEIEKILAEKERELREV